MISQARLNEYVRHLNRLGSLAGNEFQRYYNIAARRGDGYYTRDVLLRAMTSLTSVYGDMAAVLAAELYEELRAMEYGGTYEAVISDPWGSEHFEKPVKYASRRFFGNTNAQESVNYLKDRLTRAVKQSAHNTIADNAIADSKSGVRFARIPTATACDYCRKIASYGYCFPSRERAGEFKKFHNNCNCTIMASWEGGHNALAGYDRENAGLFTMPN